MLQSEPGLHCPGVRGEGGNGRRRRLSHQKAWRVQEEQQAADHGHFPRKCREAFLHATHAALFRTGEAMQGTSRGNDCSSRCKSQEGWSFGRFLTDAIGLNRVSRSIHWNPTMTDTR